MAYATVSEVRALPGLESVADYPDDALQQGIDFATALVDDYCGPMEPKSVTVSLAGVRGAAIFAGVPRMTAVTACTVGGVAQTGTASWIVTPDGWVVREDGGDFLGWVVSLTVTAGPATTPPEVRWAVRTLAAQYVLDLYGRVPDRALSVTSEFGNIQLAQAGGPGRPTNLPDVNAVLNRYRVRYPL